LKACIEFFIILMLLVPASYAWKAETHKNIIEYVYLNLPEDTQSKLDLGKLKNGAVMPDRDFRDFRNHHYPNSLREAEKWLKNDTDISLNIGIASHYITDSFSAPHNIAGEKYSDHNYFEKQVEYYYPVSDCADYGFDPRDMHIAVKNNKDWNLWLNTKDRAVPEREVEEATKFLFSVVLKKLNATCSGISAEVAETKYITKRKLAFIITVVLGGLYFLKR